MKNLLTSTLLTFCLLSSYFINGQTTERKLKIEVSKYILMGGEKTVFFKTIEVLSSSMHPKDLRITFSKDYTNKLLFQKGEQYILTLTSADKSSKSETNKIFIVDERHFMGRQTPFAVGTITLFSKDTKPKVVKKRQRTMDLRIYKSTIINGKRTAFFRQASEAGSNPNIPRNFRITFSEKHTSKYSFNVGKTYLITFTALVDKTKPENYTTDRLYVLESQSPGGRYTNWEVEIIKLKQ